MRSEIEGLEEERFKGMDGLVRERGFPCMNWCMRNRGVRCLCFIFLNIFYLKIY
jgi:hypothetical protein